MRKYLEPQIVEKIANANEITWINPKWENWNTTKEHLEVSEEEISDAEKRLERFAPFIMKCFPETVSSNGMIESELTEIPRMQEYLKKNYHTEIPGKLFLKKDSHLAVAGSIKARGGIYEVLKHNLIQHTKHHVIRCY